MSLQRLDLPVNAVATALKNFFADLSEPVIPPEFYDELMQAMSMPNPEMRLRRLRDTLNRLPRENHDLLRYFIAHLRRYVKDFFLTKSKNLLLFVFLKFREIFFELKIGKK